MGVAPRLMRHWDDETGFAFIHQLGSVMFETAAKQFLCADCASGHNGSQVWNTEFDPTVNPQWSLMKRRFVKMEDRVQCDHCRVRVASYVAIFLDDEDSDFHDGLAYNPDKHLFWYARQPDAEAVKSRLIEIFNTTDVIEFQLAERSWQTINRDSAELAAYANEHLASCVDGTVRVERICISEHLKFVCEIQTSASGVDFSQFGIIEMTCMKAMIAEMEQIGELLHKKVLTSAGLPNPSVRLLPSP